MEKPNFEIAIPSSLEQLQDVDEFTEMVSDSVRMCEDDKDNLAIAVSEVVNNCITHGNHEDESKKVTLRFFVSEDVVTVYIRDEGEGFDPGDLDSPLDPENLLKESGRGIFILRSITDDVSFRNTGNGMEVKLVKSFKQK